MEPLFVTLKARVLERLKEGPASGKTISMALGLPRREYAKVSKVLQTVRRAGIVIRLSHSVYKLAEGIPVPIPYVKVTRIYVAHSPLRQAVQIALGSLDLLQRAFVRLHLPKRMGPPAIGRFKVEHNLSESQFEVLQESTFAVLRPLLADAPRQIEELPDDTFTVSSFVHDIKGMIRKAP